MKKLLLFVLLIVANLFTFQEIEAATFKDVPTNHFAKDAIQWGNDTNFIHGVGNNLFRPNDPISFEQFAKMTSAYFNLEQSPYALKVGGDNNYFISNEQYAGWSKKYYDQLAAYKVPYLHYHSQESFRYKPINRGLLAQVFGYLLTGEADLQKGIHFLQKEGITKMKYTNFITPELQFDIGGNLTRAEAVTFFYRLNQKGLKTLDATVVKQFNEIAENETEFNKNAAAASKKIDPRVKDYGNKAPTLYSKETIALEKQVFEKELAAYDIKIDFNKGHSATDMVGAKKMLDLITAPVVKEITQNGYSLVDAYESNDLFGKINGIYFLHPTHGYISISLDKHQINMIIGKAHKNLADSQLQLFAKITSTVTQTKITPAQIIALEKEYVKNYSPSNTMFYFDSKKTISLAPNNIGRYDILKFLNK